MLCYYLVEFHHVILFGLSVTAPLHKIMYTCNTSSLVQLVVQNTATTHCGNLVDDINQVCVEWVSKLNIDASLAHASHSEHDYGGT